MKDHWIITEEPLAGYTSRNIVRLLWQNKFRIHIKYFLRFLYGIVMSALLAPLRVYETITFSKKIRATEVKVDPVFIIGYYRSGTTYLITLFSKDTSKGYISNIEGYLPNTFLAFPRLTEWIIRASLPDERPMDSVELSPIEPTEEEYSIGAMEKYGIYNGFVFPRNFRLYSRYNSFEDMPKDLEKWKKRYEWFVKKMTVKYPGRQMIFKNPTHSYRIRTLLELYPNAKFIHIYRNPYEIFSSNVRYHRDVFSIYALQTWDDEDMQKTILENYRELYELMDRDRPLIPEGNIVDIRYEDFIKAPLKHIKSIYRDLKLGGYDQAEPAFKAHVDAQATYEPHSYTFSEDYIRKVNEYWGHIAESLGYKRLKPQLHNRG